MITILRAIVRPYLAILIGTAMTGLAIYLAIRFGDAEIAKYVVTTLITAGVAIISYYFGERSNKPKEDK